MEFFDIHTHIIPGFDDGAKDDQIAVKMLKMTCDSGINNIILTPHYNERLHLTRRAAKMMNVMHEMARTVSTQLNLFSGNEIYYSSNTLEGLSDGNIATLANSKYVLIEFSPGITYDDLMYSVNELLMGGYWPILAHVERYSCLRKKREFVDRLVSSGVYLQVNASSVSSSDFKTAKFIKNLIVNGLVSFVASDCHDLSIRPPNLMECAKILDKKYGSSMTMKLLSENPQYIIENKRITF